MIRKIIENYLEHLTMIARGGKNLQERAFEIPFRALLDAMGYECQDIRTDHGLLEFGKDIIALKQGEGPPSKVYCLQTKVGDIGKSDWNDMERQLKELLITSVNHPNVSSDTPREPIWVTTGQLTPAVEILMNEFNKDYKSQGKPEVKVWIRNRLIDLFDKHFFDITLFPPEHTLTVCQIILSLKDYQYDRRALIDFLENFLFTDPEDIITLAHSKLSSLVVISAYIVGHGREIGDLYNAYEQVQRIAVYMWRYLFYRKSDFEKLYRHYELIREILIGLAEEIIDSITEDIEAENGLFKTDGDFFTEILQYPLRIFDIIEKLSLLILFYYNTGEENRAEHNLGLLEKVIENNIASSHVMWERNMCAIWAAAVALRVHGKYDLARKWLTDLISWVSSRYKNFDGIPRPMATAQELVRHHFAMPFDFIKTEEISSSYLVPLLFEICRWFGFSDIYEWGISQFDDIQMYEFYPADEEQIYLEKMEKGNRSQVKLPKTWNQFLEWYSEKEEHSLFLPSETGNEEMLFIISFCFGNRIFLKTNTLSD